MMKVVLLKNVTSLGMMHDIKEVSDGYAMNYLLPKNIAKIVTPELLKQYKIEAGVHKKRLQKKDKAAMEIGKKFKNITLKIESKKNNEGTLYAAIQRKDVTMLLKEKGFLLSEDRIIIEKPIKEVGEYNIKIKLAQKVETVVRLKVI